jgi:fructoselysine-6-P-deglycase FrlB-like protein
MVGGGALVVGLVGGLARDHELAVLHDMSTLGGRSLAIGATGPDVAFGADLPEAICGPLYLPFGQLLAYERGIARGRDPDRPHNLSDVVRLAEVNGS